MSDAPQGPGWWLGEDGKFHPPQPTAAAAPTPEAKKKSSAGTILLCMALAIVTVVGIAVLGGKGSSKPDRFGAEYVCEEFVKDRLKSPATAEFTGAKTRQDGENWVVSGDVDSQNGFGALVRSSYVCTVKPTDSKGDNWTLVDVNLIEV